MLRFIKHNLTGIDGVEIYPIISLVVFVLFFTFMIIAVMSMKKKHISELSSIPLLDDNEAIEIENEVKKN